MFQLTWQEFCKRPYIAKLPLHEQVRQFQFEQQRHMMIMTTLTGFGSGGGVVPNINTGNNSYIDDDYVDDYFE